MNAEEYAEGVDQSPLARFVFHRGKGRIALALGYGSLCNHSYRPNARYEDEGPQARRFVALRDIGAGEEVTVNDNGSPTSRKQLWFDLAEEVKPPRASRKAGSKA